MYIFHINSSHFAIYLKFLEEIICHFVISYIQYKCIYSPVYFLCIWLCVVANEKNTHHADIVFVLYNVRRIAYLHRELSQKQYFCRNGNKNEKNNNKAKACACNMFGVWQVKRQREKAASSRPCACAFKSNENCRLSRPTHVKQKTAARTMPNTVRRSQQM